MLSFTELPEPSYIKILNENIFMVYHIENYSVNTFCKILRNEDSYISYLPSYGELRAPYTEGNVNFVYLENIQVVIGPDVFLQDYCINTVEGSCHILFSHNNLKNSYGSSTKTLKSFSDLMKVLISANS